MVELSVKKEAQTMSDKNKHMDYDDRLQEPEVKLVNLLLMT